MVALGIVCLQEHLTRCRNLHWLRLDMDRRGEGAMWIRKTVLRFEHSTDSDPSPTAHTRSRSLPPTQLSHRGVPVTPNPMTETDRSHNVRAPCTIGGDDETVRAAQRSPHLLAVLDICSNSTTDPYASICPLCPGSFLSPIAAMPALPPILLTYIHARFARQNFLIC